MKTNLGRSLVLLLGIVALLSIFTALSRKETNSKKKMIAITQIIEHPSLDQEREGILLALKEAGFVDGHNLKVVYQNAQGSTIIATQIARKLVDLKPDVLVGISTPSAQSLLAARGHRPIPIVFSAVTDPEGAKLVIGSDDRAITGVSDYLSSKPQLDLIQRFLPHVKRIGVIYNPGESNSSILYRDLINQAAERQLSIFPASAHRTSEVVAAAQNLVGKVDAIYVPNDNTAVAAMESITRVAEINRTPVFAGDFGSVQKGAIAAAGYDRTFLGKKAGSLIVQILQGKNTSSIPIQRHHPTQVLVNSAAAGRMGLEVPGGLQ